MVHGAMYAQFFFLLLLLLFFSATKTRTQLSNKIKEIQIKPYNQTIKGS